MKAISKILNVSGYTLDSSELALLQKDGWVKLQLAEIAEVKKPSLTSAVVRLADGRTKALDLSQLSTDSFAKVSDALNEAVHAHRNWASSRI